MEKWNKGFLDEIVRKTRIYIIVERVAKGFVEKENPFANFLQGDDVPRLIEDLKEPGILPEKVDDCYVQFTIDSYNHNYADMDSKFVIYNHSGSYKEYVPIEEVIADDPFYQGLKEDGFRKLTKLMIT